MKTCFQVDETLAIVKYCLSAMLKSFARPESTNRIAHLSAAAGNKKELRSVAMEQERWLHRGALVKGGVL